MKASLFAVCLSLSVLTLPVHSTNSQKSPLAKPVPIVIHKIDLNKADLSMLTGSFRGIGKQRAKAIIAYREDHHGFKSLEELAEVKGFGQRFISANREKLKEVFVIN